MLDNESSGAHINNFHPRLGWTGNMSQKEIEQALKRQALENIYSSVNSNPPTTDENFNRKCDYYYGY